MCYVYIMLRNFNYYFNLRFFFHFSYLFLSVDGLSYRPHLFQYYQHLRRRVYTVFSKTRIYSWICYRRQASTYEFFFLNVKNFVLFHSYLWRVANVLFSVYCMQ